MKPDLWTPMSMIYIVINFWKEKYVNKFDQCVWTLTKLHSIVNQKLLSLGGELAQGWFIQPAANERGVRGPSALTAS